MSVQVDSYPILPLNQENSNSLSLVAIPWTNSVLSEGGRMTETRGLITD